MEAGRHDKTGENSTPTNGEDSTPAHICAREVSRFARNSRDWQQLIEMCRVVDTVLVDQETIYAPRHGNDRLLLGLKGSLNEYELDLPVKQNNGDTTWRRPNYATIHRMIDNPIFGGAYSYGETAVASGYSADGVSVMSARASSVGGTVSPSALAVVS